MAFYDLPKAERDTLVAKINADLLSAFQTGNRQKLIHYFADEDTYIRKTAYIAAGRIYFTHKKLQAQVLSMLGELMKESDSKIRQTVVNSAGEIGKVEFDIVQTFFDAGLFDAHHSVRNAVIGSMKKMGEKNPQAVINWSHRYLHHPDKEIRREICHGIELRGRTHPEDILPLLRELQFDKTRRVRTTLVHVLGQIAYKKGCLEKVLGEITTWENKYLVADAIEEIIDVHHRYRNFSFYTQAQAREIVARYT